MAGDERREAYPYDDQSLPWLEAVDDEDGPRAVSARKMLALLLVAARGRRRSSPG
jgi:hypothetical protein